MGNATVPRQAFLEYVLSKEGASYCWGGKAFAIWTRTGLQVHGFADEKNHPVEVFDCAGLFTSALHALNGPDWRASRGAHDLATLLPKVSAERIAQAPVPAGTLACYGSPERISHVMLLLEDGRVFGAAGGGSDTTSPEIAKKQKAAVKYRPRAAYRPDLRWWVHLPLSD
jgi:cell wall-associated NlpC family hydrolase